MREEGLEQVTGLSCGSGDNQMVTNLHHHHHHHRHHHHHIDDHYHRHYHYHQWWSTIVHNHNWKSQSRVHGQPNHQYNSNWLNLLPTRLWSTCWTKTTLSSASTPLLEKIGLGNWLQCWPQLGGGSILSLCPTLLRFGPSNQSIFPSRPWPSDPRVDKLRVRVTDEVHCSMGGKAQTVVIQRDQVEIHLILISSLNFCNLVIICVINSYLQTVSVPDFKKSKTGFIFSHPWRETM